MNTGQLLIFTDLDGSLLDHETYDFSAASALLQKLQKNNIPIIFNSSKTRSELEVLQAELKIESPFIAENGAAIFIKKNHFSKKPESVSELNDYWIKEFVEKRQHWLNIINSISIDYVNEFFGFANSSVEEIMQITNLPEENAILAKAKEYSEPIKWLGSNSSKQQFISSLNQYGASVLQGGRFLHISGDCNKGQSLNWLANCYQEEQNRNIITLAIGDSNNDIDMLEAADHALIIRSPAHPPPKITTQKSARVTEKTGPVGWAEGVKTIIDSLNIELTP